MQWKSHIKTMFLLCTLMLFSMALIVAQLVEKNFQTPEARGSNLVIAKFI